MKRRESDLGYFQAIFLPLVTSCEVKIIVSQQVKKDQNANFWCGLCDTCFRSDFPQDHEKEIRKLFEHPQLYKN